MTEREILENYQQGEPHYEKAQYALRTGMSLLDFDEWCFISEVLKRNVSFHEIHLMNEYVDQYNTQFHTDYDWDWLSYPENADTQELFSRLIAFGKEKENERMGKQSVSA